MTKTKQQVRVDCCTVEHPAAASVVIQENQRGRSKGWSVSGHRSLRILCFINSTRKRTEPAAMDESASATTRGLLQVKGDHKRDGEDEGGGVIMIDLTANNTGDSSDEDEEDDAEASSGAGGGGDSDGRKKRKRSRKKKGVDHDDGGDVQQQHHVTARRRQMMSATTMVREFCRQQQLQRHGGLKISASDVGAVAGYHPYKNVAGELLPKLVYQGSAGRMLLRHDAELLGIELVSEEAVVRDLACRAGKAATEAVEDALKVKRGTKRVASVGDAQKIKDRASKEIARSGSALSAGEAKALREACRSAVDTGFGTHNEDDAIERYSKMIGWEAYSRNAEIRSWPFRKVDRHHRDNSNSNDGPCDKTVEPAGKARVLYRQSSGVGADGGDSVDDDGGYDDDDRPGGGSGGNNSEREDRESRDEKKSDAVASPARKVRCDCTGDDDDDHGGHAESSPNEDDSPPYFSVLGSIDAIRDELAPSRTVARGDAGGGDPDDDDSWYMRQVIVECKHRMKRLHDVPPIYEQIQAVVYCQMYDTTEADIVQVLRSSRRSRNQRKQQARCGRSRKRNDGVCSNRIKPPPESESDSIERGAVATSAGAMNNGDVMHNRNDLRYYLSPTKSSADIAQKEAAAASPSNVGDNNGIQQHLRRENDHDGEVSAASVDSDVYSKRRTEEHSAHPGAAASDDEKCETKQLAEQGECPKRGLGVDDSDSLLDAPASRVPGDLADTAAEKTGVSYVGKDGGKGGEDCPADTLPCAKAGTTTNNDAQEQKDLQALVTENPLKEDQEAGVAERAAGACQLADSAPKNAAAVAVGAEVAAVEERSEEAVEAHGQSLQPPLEMKVTRISLDDPIYQHRQHWDGLVLPRLRSFVDAVYAIRSDDDKRYRLLAATALDCNGNGGGSDPLMKGAWELLHRECPWLLDCDTAYNREMRGRKRPLG